MKLTFLLFSITCKAFCTYKFKGPSTQPLLGLSGTAMWNGSIHRSFLFFWTCSSASSKTGFIYFGHLLVTTSLRLWPLEQLSEGKHRVAFISFENCVKLSVPRHLGQYCMWRYKAGGLEHSWALPAFSYLQSKLSHSSLLTEEFGFQCELKPWVRWSLNSQ